MDGADGTSRRAVATKPHTQPMNALIRLPARRTSGGTAGYRESAQTPCNPPRCIPGGNERNTPEPEAKTKTPRDLQVSDQPEVEKHLLFDESTMIQVQR